jgi:hypothetical protein
VYRGIIEFKMGCHSRSNVVKDQKADMLLRLSIVFWVMFGRLIDVQLSRKY